MPALQQRSIHLAFALALVFLTVPAVRGGGRAWARGADALLAAVGVVAAGYVAWDFEGILTRSGSYSTLELWLGGALVALILEATRRTLGWPLPALALVGLAYATLGQYLPELVAHRGYRASRILTTLYLTYDGVFGAILGVSATFVFLFVLFGTFFREFGASHFFLGLAEALVGGVRGGAAKVAIIGSSLFGMISGSTVANAGTVGTVTIPMMKRAGFTAPFAAGVESAASVAGQLMPPVMGAAAFIMAEVLAIPYIKVAAAAALPAVLYYAALFVIVDLQAAKQGLRGLPASERPAVGDVLRRGWTAVVPVVVLVYLMGVRDLSPGLSCAWATAVTIALALVQGRMAPAAVARTLAAAGRGALEVAMACACVGVIIGMVTLTGLGLKLSTLLLDLSGGSLLLLLLLTMVASLVLGTALPTTATYVVLAVLVAPAIVKMGVPPIAAHLFVFYFGVIADITPPTALCVYVASSIAGAPFQRTCWLACRLAIAGFLLPFFFVYGPELVLVGAWPRIVVATLVAGVGVVALAAAIEGYLFRRLDVLERLLLVAATVALVQPGWINVVAAVALGAVALRHLTGHRMAVQKVGP
jgi:TRAP transporter 4TM/12TM fusion protein